MLPFQFTHLADTAQTYVRELQALLKERQDEVRERNRQIEDGVFAAVADPRRPVQGAAGRGGAAGAELRAARERGQRADARRRPLSSKALDGAPRSKVTPESARAVNAAADPERASADRRGGLPRRPWYRHLLYAPGYYTGYAVKTMPGVREAIEEKNYAEAEAEIVRVARALEREKALIDAAAADLERIR